MKTEKIIKPANGYLMLLIALTLFFGSIIMSIINETPAYLPLTLIGFIGFTEKVSRLLKSLISFRKQNKKSKYESE